MDSSSIRERTASSIWIATSQIKSEKQDEDLVCPICSNLLWEPVGCATCKLHTCLKCIQDWLNKGRSTCPISGCKQFIDEKPHPYFFKHLLSIRLACQNKEKGCLESIGYEQYKKHIEKECGYEQISCPSEGCQDIIMKKDVEDHLRVCEYKIIECEYCKQELLKKNVSDHNEYVCENFPTECENEQCKEVVRRIELNKHLLTCQYRLDICSYCQAIYNQTQKHLHEKSCPERMLKCKGCKLAFKQFELNQHTSACPLIRFKCKMCLEEYPQLEFASKHNKEVCMEQTILNLQKENDSLKQQNVKLMEQQKVIEDKMENIMNICFLNKKNPQSDIYEQEQIIEQCNEQIMSIFDQNQFFAHQKKKHSMDFKDVRQTLKHFEFLTFTSFLYIGWHKLHCSDCMNFVKKITPLIFPLINTIRNTEMKISKNNYRTVNL